MFVVNGKRGGGGLSTLCWCGSLSTGFLAKKEGIGRRFAVSYWLVLIRESIIWGVGCSLKTMFRSWVLFGCFLVHN